MKRYLQALTKITAALLCTYSVSRAADPKPDPHAGEQKIWEPEFNHKTYGQQIVEETMAKHPELVNLGLHMVPPGRTENVIVAVANPKRIGYPSNKDNDIWPAIENITITDPNLKDKQFAVFTPLLDQKDNILGTAMIKFKLEPGVPYQQYYKQGIAIRDELKAKIPSYHDIFRRTKQWNGNDPADPSKKIFAQQLVDETVAKHHLVKMFIHATPPGCPNVDIASTAPKRIGYESGPYDNHVSTGKYHIVEISPSEGVYEIGVPIFDSSNRSIGAAMIMFPYDPKGDAANFYGEALAIEAELKARLPDAAALFRIVGN